ncbi:uncharacterized protein LOC133875666 isoform X1 [Alnus glutinosa]|uniref:uncharacterized protein LOC133875666 isoform X1 n=1 Tax=Alnus glutinosa TaxID=3517 RepID=UPI002D79495B|nr:uncharacterized protein LOC133875666 isoform X1 [Alnus glutinosa]
MHRRESEAELRLKLTSVVARHQDMKTAFTDLKSQINVGLLQAEEVFASLAIPLMKLVGLKTEEMAQEGRFSTIIINNNDFDQEGRRNTIGAESLPKSSSALEGGDREENYAAKAAMAAGKQLLQKQQTQLVQLVRILKQIESQVNSRQNDILHTLSHHHVSLHKFFQNAIVYLSTLHYSQHHETTFGITLKLLRATFNNVGTVLGSVESSVEDLMQDLAQLMCDPMVEYVKGLRDDLNNGISVRLLAMVKEMERVIRDGRLELEEARNKVRVAEERKFEALSRLTESEERVKKMKEYLRSLAEPNTRGSMQRPVAHKLLSKQEAHAKDEKLLWELLKGKRKYQTPESPLGPKELLFSKKHHKSTTLMPSVSHRPITRTLSRGLGPHSPLLDPRIPLGSSPSVAI